MLQTMVRKRKRKKKIITIRKIIIKIKGSNGPHKKQSFKRSGISSGSSSGGSSCIALWRAAILEVPIFRDREILVVLVVHFAVNVIVDILGSVDKATEDALFVVRWDTGLISAHRANRSPNHLPYCHQFLFSRFQGLMVIPRWVMVEHIIIREI